MNVIYAFMKLLPVQKKIVYLSRQQNTVPLDYQMIVDQMEMEYPEYRNVLLVKMVPDGFVGKVGYCFYMLKQMYHLATAEAAVLDTYCIPVCVLRQRKSLIVVQIWHALGALKKFSYSILDQEEGRSSAMAKALHMHENYTYVLTSSETCRPYFREAFRVRDEQMRVIPLPRVDHILDPKVQADIRSCIFQRYPQLQNSRKKILVYAPTFRKYEVDFNRAVQELADSIDFEQYQLIVKLHPLSQAAIQNDHVIVDHEFSTSDFFQVADAVIADYSAVVIEAALLHIPLYFYAFDYEQYIDKRNFYIDCKSILSDCYFDHASDLMAAMQNSVYNWDKLHAFATMMVERTDESSAHRIVELLVKEQKEE